jgi:tetratricopeptide (TPR) repeat protein
MSTNPSPEESAEIRELLRIYRNLEAGRPGSFLEEEAFERLAVYFDEQENLKQAFRVVETGLGIFPYSGVLHLKKADLLLSERKYESALHILRSAELLGGISTELIILKTEAYLALDRQQKAITLLEEALQQFEGEERIELLFELSDVYDDYEQFDKVFDCLKIILEESPQNEEALYKICYWTDFTGRNEESIRIHLNIIEEHPFSELAWFNLGAAYQGLKLYEKAIDAYMYCVAIDEKFDYAYRNMGDAYIRMRKYKDAIEVLKKVEELSLPEDVIFKAIGYCYEKLRQPAQARVYYRKASHLDKDDSKLYFKIACSYLDEDKYEQAIKQLETALQINRKHPDYNMAMGYALSGLEDYRQALDYFTNVIVVRPKHIKGWCGLLDCFAQFGVWKELDKAAAKAYDATGQKPIFLVYRAIACLMMKKTKPAITFLEEAMVVAPNTVRKLIKLNPSLLQFSQVTAFLEKHKRASKKKKK